MDSSIKYLRKNMTKSEIIVWALLRNRQFNCYKFLRQHPVLCEWESKNYRFIIDFYCASKKLGIELDGDIHKKQVDKDYMRDTILKSKGISVLRFTNEEVLSDINLLLKKLSDYLL